MAHLFQPSRMTNSQGQLVDIYENPSEHYETSGHLKTIQPSHDANLKPHYFMEAGPNGPQLKVGYGE